MSRPDPIELPSQYAPAEITRGVLRFVFHQLLRLLHGAARPPYPRASA